MRQRTARGRGRHTIYVILSLIMLVGAVGGFWPQYFSAPLGAPLEPRIDRWPFHLHSALFVGWLAILLLQSILVAAGRTPWHRKLGPFLAGFGYLAAAFGFYVSVALAVYSMPGRRSLDEAARFVAFPLIDMVYFAGFLTAAIWWRNRAEAHKRLMVVASFSIAVVGIGRWVGRSGLFESEWLAQPAILAPLLVASAYDLWTRRRVHPVYWLGLACHLFRLNMDPLTSSEAWLRIGRALVTVQM